MSSRETTEDYHQLTDKAWDDKVESGWGEEREISLLWLEYMEKYGQEMEGSVLDIGCGKGNYLANLLKRGYAVTGLEPSDKMREAARTNLSEQGLDAKLVKGYSHELPFTDKSFDGVISLGVIHHNHWEDIEKSFSEVARVLKDQGLAIISVRSNNDNDKERNIVEQRPSGGFLATDKEGKKEGVAQYYFSQADIEDLATKYGLELVEQPREKIKSVQEEDPGRQRARWYFVLRKKKQETNDQFNK